MNSISCDTIPARRNLTALAHRVAVPGWSRVLRSHRHAMAFRGTKIPAPVTTLPGHGMNILSGGMNLPARGTQSHLAGDALPALATESPTARDASLLQRDWSRAQWDASHSAVLSGSQRRGKGCIRRNPVACGGRPVAFRRTPSHLAGDWSPGSESPSPTEWDARFFTFSRDFSGISSISGLFPAKEGAMANPWPPRYDDPAVRYDAGLTYANGEVSGTESNAERKK